MVCLWLTRLDAAPDGTSRAMAVAAVAEVLTLQPHPEQLVASLMRMLAPSGSTCYGSSGSRGVLYASLVVPTLLEILFEVQKHWPQASRHVSPDIPHLIGAGF